VQFGPKDDAERQRRAYWPTAAAVAMIAYPSRAVTDKSPRVVDVAMATEHRLL